MSISPSPVLPNRVDQRETAASLPVSDERQTRQIFLIAIVSALATIPVWVASYPPMADLPQHAAQVAMLHNLHDPAFQFSGLFWINWFTPYLFGYMAVYALTPLFGIVTACKLVIALALLGLPVATAVFAEHVNRRLQAMVQ